MFEITTRVPVATSGAGPDANTGRRRERIALSNRHCEKRVDKRTKIYDRKCAGLYVSITTAGVATFYAQIKGRCARLGVHNPTTFNVDDARAAVYALRARIGAGENVFETLRQHKALRAKQGLTVDEIIAERVEWIKAPVRKPFGEMRSRVETWRNVESHMRRFISPRLGRMIAADVTNDDIAGISNEIAETSVSNARHFRRSVGSLFKWAAEAGRKYVERSPYHDLPKLPREHARKRCLCAGTLVSGTSMHPCRKNASIGSIAAARERERGYSGATQCHSRHPAAAAPRD